MVPRVCVEGEKWDFRVRVSAGIEFGITNGRGLGLGIEMVPRVCVEGED